MIGRRALLALAAVGTLLLASCGPRWESTQQATNVTADELGNTSDAGVSGGSPAAGGTTAGAAGRSGSAGSSTTAASNARAQLAGALGGGGARTTAGQTYRGATAKAITIGIMASQTINEAYAAFGATGAAFPDPKKQVEPIVKWINAHGGVAGRQLNVLWHMRDDLSGDTDATKSQQACTDFTQDKKVFLVTSIYQAHQMAPCLADHDIPLVESGTGPPWFGVPSIDKLKGFYLTPNQISFDRYSTALVDGIFSRGYFKGAVKVGLIYMAFPHAKAAVQRSLKPALARHGVKLLDEQELKPLERASDFAGTQAEVSSAVLRFKNKGINRVIALEDQATTFMLSAEQQDYYPKYGIGSLSLFGAASSNPESMKNTMLVGVSPPLDVLPADQGGLISPLEKTCRDIYIGSRQDPADDLAWGLMRLHCEGLFFLKATFDLSTLLSSKGFISAAGALGDRYQSMTTYGMKLSGRFDGVAKAHPLKFVPQCECVRYAGPVYAIP